MAVLPKPLRPLLEARFSIKLLLVGVLVEMKIPPWSWQSCESASGSSSAEMTQGSIKRDGSDDLMLQRYASTKSLQSSRVLLNLHDIPWSPSELNFADLLPHEKIRHLTLQAGGEKEVMYSIALRLWHL
jgi:hypothetical protein